MTKKNLNTLIRLRGVKILTIRRMLLRKRGVTRKELLTVLGWKAISVPAMARASGLKLTRKKVLGTPTRYFGK